MSAKAKNVKKKKKKKSPMQQLVTKIVMVLLLVVGFAIMLYPFYSDALNTMIAQHMLSEYQKEANAKNAEVVEKQRKELEAKNKELAETGGNPGVDPFEKEATSGIGNKSSEYFKEHLIGSVTIPAINVKVPVYDTTSEYLLAKGASVLNGTSYPTGGEGTHSVISAHRGLEDNKLFTDLPDLKVGDTFLLDILNQKLAYEVDQIETIEPTEMGSLRLVEGQDLVTLMTCTPYMINSHRYLVRGHRIPYVPEKMDKQIEKVEKAQNNRSYLVFAGIGLLALLLLFIIYRSVKTYRKQKVKRLVAAEKLAAEAALGNVPEQGETASATAEMPDRDADRAEDDALVVDPDSGAANSVAATQSADNPADVDPDNPAPESSASNSK